MKILVTKKYSYCNITIKIINNIRHKFYFSIQINVYITLNKHCNIHKVSLQIRVNTIKIWYKTTNNRNDQISIISDPVVKVINNRICEYN